MTTMLLHIPMRQQWRRNEDLIELVFYSDDDLHLIKMWVIFGCFGHIELFKKTMEDLLKMHKSELKAIVKKTLSQLCNYMLRLAASEGVFEVVKLLLDSKIDGVDAAVEENDCIKWASARGHLNVVTLLLEQHGVDPTCDDYEAFQTSADSGYFDVLKVLLESVKGDDKFRVATNESLYGASLGGHFQIVKHLLELPGVDVGFDDNCVFIAACRRGHVELAKFLLGVDGVDPCDDDNVAFIAASECGRKEILELLLTVPGSNASAADNRALRLASSNGDLDIVTLLLGIPGVDASAMDNEAIRCIKGVDATACNNEAIREASINGHTKVVEEVLRVPGIAANNNAAILGALENDHVMVVRLLLGVESVCSLDVGIKALEFVASKGYMDLVKLLVEVKGVDAFANDNAALRAACLGQHLDVIRYLALWTNGRV
ncbi:hypothetical protein HDU76_005708 [Blyttiomyces sp. JEL0837]|nr:hypothetical protein HDU76_005708 [Blyttiomyces sp. JEL0837]